MVGVFVPLYLLTNGYSFTEILIFYAIFYGARIPFDIITGLLVARFGPKHVMRVSFLMQIVFSLMLINLESIPWAIVVLGIFAAVESSLYFVSYHVDFSKIKHKEHGGKELSFLTVMERVGGVAGPFIGGAVATIFAPVVTFWVAAGAMLIATIILMLSPEPVQTRQKLNFSGMLTKISWRNRIAFGAHSGEYTISMILWPIYLSVIVFTVEGYLKLGIVSSVSVLAAILVTVPLGRILDKQNGKGMIVFGSIANSAISLVRLLASNLPTSIAVSAVHEPNMLVYRMPIIKGFYDETDDYPGQRIVFIICQEAFNDVIRFALWLSLIFISLKLPIHTTITIGFVLAAALSLLMNLQKFKAIK